MPTDHIARAEELLAAATAKDGSIHAESAIVIAAAQAHATIAVAQQIRLARP